MISFRQFRWKKYWYFTFYLIAQVIEWKKLKNKFEIFAVVEKLFGGWSFQIKFPKKTVAKKKLKKKIIFYMPAKFKFYLLAVAGGYWPMLVSNQWTSDEWEWLLFEGQIAAACWPCDGSGCSRVSSVLFGDGHMLAYGPCPSLHYIDRLVKSMSTVAHPETWGESLSPENISREQKLQT